MSYVGGSDVSIGYYEQHAAVLADRWSAISQDEFYSPVRHLIPDAPCRTVDIGAGSGLGACWFAGLGHQVTAVEPVERFLSMAPAGDIRWINDRLPDLRQLIRSGEQYDLLNLVGVWHHLAPDERANAAVTLGRLAASCATLVMALRRGPLPAGLPIFPIDIDETVKCLSAHGFSEIFRKEAESLQPGNRAEGVRWVWLVMQMEDRT